MNSEELREEIAKQLRQWDIDAWYGCPQEDLSGNPSVQTSWLSEPKHIKDKYLKEADQILSIFLDQTKGDCPECGGKGRTIKHQDKYKVILGDTCPVCKGTGKGEWHPDSLVVLGKSINPYPETLIDDATGQVFENDKHKAWDEGYLCRRENE